MLYRMFDSRLFPATSTWPPGIAAAEAIRAGDSGNKRAALLGLGLLVGLAGSGLKIPMSAFGAAFIGNVWALTMFGIGLLVRGYATQSTCRRRADRAAALGAQTPSASTRDCGLDQRNAALCRTAIAISVYYHRTPLHLRQPPLPCPRSCVS
jgi:hypothetical protein